jgi:AAA+ superfamily predicted ATPase
MKEFNSFIRAGYPALWVQSSEEERTLKTLYHSSGDCLCFRWDVAGGLVNMSTNEVKPLPSPVGAVQAVMALPDNSVLFLLDFHAYVKSPEVQRAIKNNLQGMKATGRHIVIISPVSTIPVELEKVFTVLDFELPSIEELKAMAKRLCEDSLGAGCFTEGYYEVMKYARGLTMIEAENGVSRGLVQGREIDKGILEQEKLQMVRKSGLCELFQPIPMENLRGLENLKEYIRVRKGAYNDSTKPPLKGVLLFGAPGTGKSLAAKCIGSEFGWPVLKADSTTFSGGIVGESARKTKDFWKLARASSPCVVWLDECEKIFGGVQSSNRTDGGAGSSAFGIFLNEMEETTKNGYQVYVVGTVNDIDELMASSQGALVRRFDTVFYCDLPSENERLDILTFMAEKYGADVNCQEVVSLTDGWSGAEIEKMIVDSLYEGVKKAAENIHPVYFQNKDVIDRARDWARVNARPANRVIQNFFDVQSFKRALDLHGLGGAA